MAFHNIFPHTDLFLMPPSPIPPPIPKLGQTRCYWALLSADLDFLYIDPVFCSHLGTQANSIIGKKLLEFVHPDEHSSAQQDLGKVLESRTLHGSVTRVRYSRLGRLRTRLGYTGVTETFTDEDKVSFDENYIACDLVINWAAEGLVLCFIHAVVDLSPQDNDEHRRTHWTNWCGTPRMNEQHGTDLYHALFHVAPQGAQGAPPPTRVFQILHNSTDRPTLFSWPPEGYIPADYGRLANDVQIGGANGSDAKTSCTRRYKAQQLLNSADGSVRDVESIFIPHGHIIFACHKATPRRPRGHPNSYPLYPTPAQFYDHIQPQSYYPPPPVVPSQPQPVSQLDSYPAYPYHGATPSSSTSTPSPVPPPQTRTQYTWAPPAGPSSAPASACATAPATHSSYAPPQAHSPASHAPHPHTHVPHQQAHPHGSLDSMVPPPRRRSSPVPTPTPSPSSSTFSHPRAAGNPPVGISRCAACKSTSSPEWRKGPSGRKDLCNACGLRYSRARAKKEGVVVQRRRKEKGRAADGGESVESSAGGSQQRQGEVTGSGSGSYSVGVYQYPQASASGPVPTQGPGVYLGHGGASSPQNGYGQSHPPHAHDGPTSAQPSYERSHVPP